MPDCPNCTQDPCVCRKSKRPTSPPVPPENVAPDDYFVRRAVLRWMNGHGDIRDLMLEEFMNAGGGPDHPDYLQLEEFMQRNAERLKVRALTTK